MSYQAVQAAAGLRALVRLLDDADVLAGFDKAKSDDVQAGQGARRAEMNDIVGPMRSTRTHQTLRPYFFLRCKQGGDEARA